MVGFVWVVSKKETGEGRVMHCVGMNCREVLQDLDL